LTRSLFSASELTPSKSPRSDCTEEPVKLFIHAAYVTSAMRERALLALSSLPRSTRTEDPLYFADSCSAFSASARASLACCASLRARSRLAFFSASSTTIVAASFDSVLILRPRVERIAWRDEGGRHTAPDERIAEGERARPGMPGAKAWAPLTRHTRATALSILSGECVREL